ARRRTAWSSWTTPWWASRVALPRPCPPPATSARGNSSRRCSERRSAQVVVEARDGLREVRAPEAEAHVQRLFVDAAGQQQHVGALGDLLAPALHVAPAGDAREADRAGA